jgi:uncharacterized protein (TIGR02118 family)
MIKVSVFYPNKPDGRFDMEYYLKKHIPLSVELLSAAAGFQGVSVERGVGGGSRGAKATYAVMCHFVFDSFESFQAAFGPSSAKLQGDMPNYTDIEAVIQISEVVIA